MPNSQEFVLIIEDERLVAENVAAILRQAGYAHTGIATSFTEARAFGQHHNLSLIISDININGQLVGPQIVKELQQLKDVPVIYLTAYSEEQVVEEALDTQPTAYVLKPFTERQLLVAVKMALKKQKEAAGTEQMVKPSLRELEIIRYLTAGYNSKKIGLQLFISEHTVNTHRRNLLKRYNVESSSELIALSVRNKWIRL